MPIRVVVADAHRLVADALALALKRDFGFEVLDYLPMSGREVLACTEEFRPDVVLLDYWLPGMKAPATTRMILARSPKCTVLLMSWLLGVDHIVEGMAAGAAGFLPKTLYVKELASAILQAWSGGTSVYEKDLERLIVQIDERRHHAEEVWQRLAEITPRELEVLDLMNKGRVIEEVANVLSVKPATVRKHIHNILDKTRTQSYIQALAMARDHGLV